MRSYSLDGGSSQGADAPAFTSLAADTAASSASRHRRARIMLWCEI